MEIYFLCAIQYLAIVWEFSADMIWICIRMHTIYTCWGYKSTKFVETFNLSEMGIATGEYSLEQGDLIIRTLSFNSLLNHIADKKVCLKRIKWTTRDEFITER